MMRVAKILVLALLFLMIVGVAAQDSTPIPPPDGYLDSCEREPRLYEWFGPLCLNPVQWDIAGYYPINTWVYFLNEDGTTDGGLIMGFMWVREENRYWYYVQTQMPYGNFTGAYEVIPPEIVIQSQQAEFSL